MFKKFALLGGFICLTICMGNFGFSETNTKPVIAILNLEPKSVTPEIADFVTEQIGIEVIKTGSFQVLERQKMEKILEEQKLQLSGLTGSEYALKLGKLLSAQKLLVGSVSKIEDSMFITVRIVNVETGLIETGDTQEVKNVSEISAGVKTLIDRMIRGTTSAGTTATIDSTDEQFSIEGVVNYVKAKTTNTIDIINRNFTLNIQVTNPNAVHTTNVKCEASTNWFMTAGVVVELTKSRSAMWNNTTFVGDNLSVGGEYSWLLNNNWGVGLEGKWGFMFNSPSTTYTMSYAYGGPKLVFSFPFEAGTVKMRAGAEGLIGIGAVMIDNSAVSNSDSVTLSLILRPNLYFAVQLFDYFELRLEGGYEFYTGFTSIPNSFSQPVYGLHIGWATDFK